MNILLTGMGMITSVGHDTATACASIRAEISRPKQIAYFQVIDEQSQETVPLLGFPIQGVSEGFNIVGLWIPLGLMCLNELLISSSLPLKSDGGFWAETGLIAVTPSASDSRFGDNGPSPAALIREAYLDRLIAQFDYPIPDANMDVICIGHAGTISAIERASQMITNDRLARVIILAVDSYLDPITLEWLQDNERLKSPLNPVGVAPGEAAISLLVESLESSKARNSVMRLRIGKPALGFEKDNLFSGELSQGVGLSKAISSALLSAGLALPFPGTVISDMNGEYWRANELGNVRVRTQNELSSAANFSYPAMSVGEIGAASGALSICVAAKALQRRYANGQSVLVISSSETGEVGAVTISI